MMNINMEKLRSLSSAYIQYEISEHGVDPRETLEGTVLRDRSKAGEGYKYDVYEKYHEKLKKGAPYQDIIIEALPGRNLVSHFQKERIVEKISKLDNDDFEMALQLLFDGEDDEHAFNEIVSVIGGVFDVIGFIFFLKDINKYLPMRSRRFDEKLAILDVDANLEGQCSWKRYKEFI